jgi:hypothetical protein
VTVKVAVVVPAVTVTEAGTLKRALLLASVTIEPPVAAAELRTTVQPEVASGLIVPGLQAIDEIVGIVMIPLVPAETGSAPPPVSTPIGLITAIVAVPPALAASVS